MNLHPSRRWITVLLFSSLSLPVWANAHKSDAWAHTQFAEAEQERHLLNELPPERQTRRAYQDVIGSYRRVYYGCPISSKADASVLAVADLLAEMGRHIRDTSYSRSAIAQYGFLRREYPGSRYRVEALFDVGNIYANDLNDAARARKTFEDFIRQYPRNHLAGDARAALANPQGPSPEKRQDEAAEYSKVDSAATASADPKGGPQRASVASQVVLADDPAKPAHIVAIHYWTKDSYTRVAIDLDHAVSYKSQRIENPDRIFFDLDAMLSKKLIGKTLDVDDELLKKIRVAQFQPARARIVLEIGEHSDFSASVETNPPRLIINLKDSQIQTKDLKNKDVESSANVSRKRDSSDPKVSKTIQRASLQTSEMLAKRIVNADDDDDDAGTVAKVTPPISLLPKTEKSSTPTPKRFASGDRRPRQIDVREAQPTANGDRSLIRALGLKIGKIVIDPGHGGHDTGTIGPRSLEEKDLVLDVSRRLGKLLESRLGAQVVYTRKDDTFIPLETRTAIANQEQADLFVSVHANSSHDPAARGVETYYLNFSSSPDALEVAARENAVSETSIHELQDLVKQIALKEKIEESREFASDVQQELHSGLSVRNPGLRDRGVKKAPFIVLIGANMPSILAEISFVSNPGDERRLETAAYRQKIAESLYRGISKYVSGLSGVKVASRIEKPSAQ
jgi:N-acetylmuramoyl-L-alanine amidase